jgi:predicted nucleic acid-binding Zn ribbon protein
MSRFRATKPTLKEQQNFVVELMNKYWCEANYNDGGEDAKEKVYLCMCITSIYDRLLSKDIIIKGENNLDFEIVETYLEHLQRNTKVLHQNSKKCPCCGKNITPKQETCSTRCRVRLHRSRNRLKEFNQKAGAILKAKDPEARFVVEQILTDKDKCPFVVIYKGHQYKSDSTRSLLTQLKKL